MLKRIIEITNLFRSDDSGASMVEYGIALVVSAALGVGAMVILGSGVATNVSGACGIFGLIC